MQQKKFSPKQLFEYGNPKPLSGRNLDYVAFPLGGIGTGSVSLGGWGQLRDWEIWNRPDKGKVWENTFFTLKVNAGKSTIPVVKVLQGPPGGDFGFHGHTAPNAAGEQLPHFRKCSFAGSFPFARVALKDEQVPLDVSLEAFNPFIPLNDKDSGIPVAILRYHLKNTGTRAISGIVYGNLRNKMGEWWGGASDKPKRINERRSENGLTGLRLTAEGVDPASPRYGSMVLATSWKDADVCPRWKEEHLLKFWDMVTETDEFPKQGNADIGTVGARFALAPGESAVIPFFITWYFPNFAWYCGPDVPSGTPTAPDTKKATWRNYYATVWSDAWDVANYAAKEGDRLYAETKLFHDMLFASTLPSYVLDAISSQISILKTTTCLRLTNGIFYGFEGCGDTGGCCEGSCTHVWNYAQALPYLFPALQRSMREADYTYAMRADGCVEFRIPLPLGTKPEWKFPPAADGQMGTVIQIYREWLISGDDAWLKKMWPLTKKALEFAWKYWDPDKNGVMEGVQHNTYDIEYYGPNPFSGVMYLGALRAAEEMARVMGEPGKAQAYHELFVRGSQWIDRNLFNGEYYEQQVNHRAIDLIPDSDSVIKKYVHTRARDDKFPDWRQWQMGKGCLADQLMGQWYARMLGLGSLLNEKNARKAAQSIFKNNWKTDFTNHATLSAPRIYAANEEKGLLICTWPKGGRPGYPSLYGDEVWTGIEYEAATELIYEGFLEEGLSIVRGARERYTGERRNPWDEIECGHHYARAMSSYALLLALSGFSYSAPEARIGFAPRVRQNNFAAFFSVGSGWGQYRQKIKKGAMGLTLEVKKGCLRLRRVTADSGKQRIKSVKVCHAGKNIEARLEQVANGWVIVFKEETIIHEGEALEIKLG